MHYFVIINFFYQEELRVIRLTKMSKYYLS